MGIKHGCSSATQLESLRLVYLKESAPDYQESLVIASLLFQVLFPGYH